MCFNSVPISLSLEISRFVFNAPVFMLKNLFSFCLAYVEKMKSYIHIVFLIFDLRTCNYFILLHHFPLQSCNGFTTGELAPHAAYLDETTPKNGRTQLVDGNKHSFALSSAD